MQVRQEVLEQNGRVFGVGVSASEDGSGMLLGLMVCITDIIFQVCIIDIVWYVK